MRDNTRAALAAAPLSLVLLLAACSRDDDSADATTTTTTTTAATSSSPTTASTEPPTTPTTSTPPPTEPPSSETTVPPDDGSQAGDPLPTDQDEWASELIRAWGAGDRERAAELASPTAVDQLFGYRDPGGDDWELDGCDGAAGSLRCTFSSASLAQTVITEQSAPNGVVQPIARVTVP